MRVVATAGHVDHGKSSLVLALTGTDPDRFPEEKARGLTIDLGFAFTELAGEIVGFVDVPGHVKFVKNMLAGVGAVEVAMVIVAATEGWMPQSEEHVRILDLLDVRHGLIVITKADLVDDETLELAELELAEHLEGTALQAWPVVACDSLSGRGLDDVRSTLQSVLDEAPAARDLGRPRLWIDRVFAAKGAGTVVTGTLTLGSLAVDDDVVIEPGGRVARVRGLESHHEQQDRVGPGSRVAVNLSGIDHTDVGRGDAIVHPHQWASPMTVDVAVTEVPGGRLPRRGRLAVHVGSGEVGATWRLLDDDRQLGRLRLDRSVPLAPGDRLVLRSTGRRITVGGATVLDVAPPRRATDAIARADAGRELGLLTGRDWVPISDLVALAGVDIARARLLVGELVANGVAVRIADAVTSRQYANALIDASEQRVRDHHRTHPHDRGLDVAALAGALHADPARLRALLDSESKFTVEQEIVRLSDHVGRACDDPDGQRLIAALDAEPFAPPSPAEVGAPIAIVRALVREGAIVDLDGVVFSTAALASARRLLATAVLERGSYTVADARDVLGSSRKFVLAIVNQLDREGVTRRRGDERIPGPRAEAAARE